MNDPQDLDRRLDDWMTGGPSIAPERVIGLAVEHAARHPRRRDRLAVLRRDPMASSGSGSAGRTVTLLAAAALLVVAAVAAISVGGWFDRQAVVVPPGPSASPTAEPSTPVAPSPSAVPQATASPSPVAIRVVLPDEFGNKAFVEVSDRSGTLVSARSGQESEAGQFVGDPSSQTISVANLKADPASVLLMWLGCPSDTRHVLTIESDARTMTLEQPACEGDTLGVTRVIVLTFSDPVPASEVIATVRALDAPSASPSSSAGTVRIDLADSYGSHPYVEVADLSGTFMEGRSAEKPEAAPLVGEIGAANLPENPSTIVLSWVGCPSDTRHVLTIAADGRTLTLEQPACQGDTLGVARGLVLTFTNPVMAGDVHAVIDHVGG